MKERPILFSGEMVRAILRGDVSQTRRVIKSVKGVREFFMAEGDIADVQAMLNRRPVNAPFLLPHCPYGQPCDRLWVKHVSNVFPVYFKPIPGWEDRYAAGTDGIIYSIDHGRPDPLQGSPSSKGYLTVSLSRGARETKAVHKLICETYYGSPPFKNAQVRHVDGNQTNNRPENLDWGTQEQNWQDRKAHGRGMGEEHHASKLTAIQVAEIRTSELSQLALATYYGVSQSTIWAIRAGQTWSNHCVAPRNLPSFHLWQSSIFMPKWASRITLEITGVRVERLQEITPNDVLAEGMTVFGKPVNDTIAYKIILDQKFIKLWDSINAKRGYPWDSNPWVWVIEFRRIEP